MVTCSIRLGARLSTLALALGVLGLWGSTPPDASAQERRVVAPAGPGWIGFSYNVVVVPVGSSKAEQRIVVERIVDGSPAEQAGFRPGDILLSINGRDATPSVFERVRSRLAPGDSVSLEILRGSWRTDVALRAARQPSPEMVALPREFVLKVDSALQRLDSLSIHISTADGVVSRMIVSSSGSSVVLSGEAEVRRVAPKDSAASPWPLATFTWTHELSVAPGEIEIGKPFDLFFYEQEPDSLKARLKALEEAYSQARAEELQRRQALERAGDRAAQAIQEDAALQDHVRRRAELEVETQRLREVLRSIFPDASPALAGMAEVDRELRATFRLDSLGRAGLMVGGVAPNVRPLSAYIQGENRVAGAQITSLNPELAAYFEVDGGLLVTDVTDGTPAAEAGIQPGDVILRVGGADVATLNDVRRALLGRTEWPVPVTLVRRGEELEVRLPR